MERNADSGADRPLRLEDLSDPEFQSRWRERHELPWEHVEAAFRHGFGARDRFADRPFPEVENWLQESWQAAHPELPWDRVRDVVESGYERFKGAGLETSTDSAAEALGRFATRTLGGSTMGRARLGDTPQMGSRDTAAGESS